MPTSDHWTALKKLLWYLSGTQDLGITLTKVKDFEIICYCDADWRGGPIDRKSHTGYLIYIGRTLVSWFSKKQSVLARSSTEVEYRTIATTVEQEAEGVSIVNDKIGSKNSFTNEGANRYRGYLYRRQPYLPQQDEIRRDGFSLHLGKIRTRCAESKSHIWDL